ncbi:hypothetical protein L1887_31727 [Cichorium endivia]|nr:hypothetical protein L1887_31727 [Cichorium endivia]
MREVSPESSSTISFPPVELSKEEWFYNIAKHGSINFLGGRGHRSNSRNVSNVNSDVMLDKVLENLSRIFLGFTWQFFEGCNGLVIIRVSALEGLLLLMLDCG